MIDSEKLVSQMSAFIENNLGGRTPFRSTSDFISYIAYKESQKKSDGI
jgi:hypothetical protein